MNFSNAILKYISVHKVGNKGAGQELVYSKQPLVFNNHSKVLLRDAFLAKFQQVLDKYSFHHPSSLKYNEVYNYCLDCFGEIKSFHSNSVNIATHLYNSTIHPKIKPGELYVCYFENCLFEGKFIDMIGLFKTESKNSFIDLTYTNDSFEATIREGVDITKFDKACLIFSTNNKKGFDVLIYDNNKGEEAVFWKETFLNIIPQATEYYQTNEFLTLTKEFISKQIPEEFEISKTDQIDYLNRSVEYFREKSSFNKKQFEKEIFQDNELIKSFRNFEHNYSESYDLALDDNFQISVFAVKKQARIFKSVLKLDKNFHIYIHGDKELIEKGYDSRVGKHYYKIYFDEES